MVAVVSKLMFPIWPNLGEKTAIFKFQPWDWDVSVEDIAAVAAVTLTDPGRHAGRAYAPTGPQALTMAEAAGLISEAVGRTISYRDTDREEWIAAMVDAGVPAEYADVLRPLTVTMASGNGARPNGDVRDVTGEAPVTFAEFAAATASAWK